VSHKVAVGRSVGVAVGVCRVAIGALQVTKKKKKRQMATTTTMPKTKTAAEMQQPAAHRRVALVGVRGAGCRTLSRRLWGAARDQIVGTCVTREAHVLGGGDSGGSGGGGGDSCGSGSGGGDSCGSGSGSGGGDSCGSGVSRFFGIVSAADADGNGSADGGQSDRRISAAADSAAAAEDVLVHIDGRELYATNHIEAERSVMAALGRCDALVFLWSFGGYWFPHSELERWLNQ
jgi:hypothetical protein